jgi:hypothetical protein
VTLTSTPDPIPVDSSRGYSPADLVPVDIIYSGQTSGKGSQTWSGSSTADTSDFALGSESRSVTTGGGGALLSFATTFSTPLNLTGKYLVVWIKEINEGNFLTGYPRIYLGDAALTNAYFWRPGSTPAQPYGLDGEWIRITLPFGSSAVVGSPSRSSLATLTIQVVDNSAGVAIFKLGGMMTVNEPSQWPNGVVSLAFDDGFLTHATVAKPYMDHYGYRGTMFLITETLWNHGGGFASYMDLAQVKQQEVDGWEAATHAYTAAAHNAGYVSIGDVAAFNDMVAGKSYLVQQGARAPEQFAYPLGVFDAKTLPLVSRLFGSGRSISSVGSYPDETFPPANLNRLRSFAVIAGSSVATVEGYITAAFNNKEWLILVFHDLVASGASGNSYLIADFQTLIDFINTTGIPVRPISEVLKSG